MDFTNLNFLSFSIFFILNFVIIFVFYIGYKRQISINKNFIKLNKSKFFYIKYIFLILSFLILSFSIFGIKISTNSFETTHGLDIVFVLDVSKSMNVYDVNDKGDSISRLEFAKNAIGNFAVNNRENRYSLVIFAGEAISTIPLTTDLDIFLTTLQNVDYRNLTIQGTDFNKAFYLGFNRLSYSSDNSKALIFISDGGDIDDIIDEKYLNSLRENNKNDEVFIVGVGSDNGGKIVSGIDVFGRINYLTYMGENVISKLNENNLIKLKNIFKSNYLKLDDISSILKFNNDLDKLEKKVVEKNNSGVMIDFSRILSLVSFVLFLTFFILYIFEDKIFLKKNLIK